MKTLYKKNVNDTINEWTIEVNGSKFRTHEGLVNGAITTSEWTQCEGKNIGKKNETTPEDQALKEAKAKYKKKKDKGYVEDIKDIDNKKFFQPMLAKSWDDYKKKIDLSFGLFSDPKLDGIRCITCSTGMFSRNGKPIVSAPHIFEALKPIFEKYPNLVLDGELYNHKYKNDFNKIVSLTRKTKPKKEDLEESKRLIQYWIYDSIFEDNDELCFWDRKCEFVDLFLKYNLKDNKSLKVVHSRPINDFNQLDGYYKHYLEQGFEGQMVRTNSPYENKRSKHLLKRKEFVDEECEILDIEEGIGNRAEMMGRIVLKRSNGVRFESTAKGNNEFYKDLLLQKSKYIGKLATVRYQNLTPDGVPRFPVVQAIRNYE